MPPLFLSMTLRGSYSNFGVVLAPGSTSKVLRITVNAATTISCANRLPEIEMLVIKSIFFLTLILKQLGQIF